MENVQKQFNEALEQFINANTGTAAPVDKNSTFFADLTGKDKITIDGQETKLFYGEEDEITVTNYVQVIPAKTINSIYDEFIDTLTTAFEKASVSGVANQSPNYNTELLKTMQQLKDNVSFPNDAKIAYKLNDKNEVIAIELPEYTFSVKDNDGEAQDYTVEADITFGGINNLYSGWRLYVALGDGEEYILFDLTYQDKSTKDVYEVSFDLAIILDDLFGIEGTMKWEPEKSEDNFSLNLNFQFGDDTAVLNARGLMQENADSFLLDLPNIEAASGGENFSFAVRYALRAATADDFTVDLANSRSLFDLSEQDLMNLLYKFY